MANVEFRRRLLAGEPLVGVITHLDSVDLVEIIGHCGYDYVLLDAEHGAHSDERLAMMLRTARSVNLPTVVRVRDNHPKSILRVCDLGADGVMVPQVESADEARQAIEAIRYAPEGTRGLHPATRGGEWGTLSVAEHIRRQHEGVCSWIQIETLAGVDQAAEIARVPGVDAVIVGPSDLSQSMGFSGQPLHPEVEAATDRAFAAAQEAGVRCGSVAGTAERAAALRDRGATIFIGSVVGIVMNGLKQQSAALRAPFA